MLKVSYEVLQPSDNCSFLVRKFNKTAFTAPYHSHPEYELTLILQGAGRRYTGSNMDNFANGDLVLLGSDLPHCWKLEKAGCAQEEASAIVVQFADDFLGNEFLTKAELSNIEELLRKKSRGGIQFKGITAKNVGQQMAAMYEDKNRFNRLIRLLKILQHLACSEEFLLLDPRNMMTKQPAVQQDRIKRLLAYVVENFRKEISLNQAAETINMTPNAFCKYFKKLTRKTFMEMVIDYRLNYAARQLAQTDKPVSFICYECGFGDISHFYKKFKTKTGLSPSRYRKEFMLIG